MSVKKRDKSKNFTEVEKETLIQIIQRYKHIVENKITDGASIAKKNAAWEAITKDFNANISSGNRNCTQIKNLYKNMKKKCRLDIATENKENYLKNMKVTELNNEVIFINSGENSLPSTNETVEFSQDEIYNLKKQRILDKKELFKTGGGTFQNTLTDHGAHILSLVAKQMKPLQNPYDDDAMYHDKVAEDSSIVIPLVEEDEEQPNLLPASLSPSKTNCKKRKRKITTKLLKTIYFKNKVKLSQFQILAAQREHKLKLKLYKEQFDQLIEKRGCGGSH